MLKPRASVAFFKVGSVTLGSPFLILEMVAGSSPARSASFTFVSRSLPITSLIFSVGYMVNLTVSPQRNTALMQRYSSATAQSRILHSKSLQVCNIQYGTGSGVKDRGETLADYVSRVRVQEKHLSLTAVGRNSGGQIDGSYVSRIENGIVTNVSPEKLSALAKGLDVPEDEIFAVARGQSMVGDLTFSELRMLEDFRSLTPPYQSIALDFMTCLVRAQSQPSTHPAVVSNTAGESPLLTTTPQVTNTSVGEKKEPAASKRSVKEGSARR